MAPRASNVAPLAQSIATALRQQAPTWLGRVLLPARLPPVVMPEVHDLE